MAATVVSAATGDDAHFPFFRTFFASVGALRLLVLALLLSLGIGSVVSIVPEVLSDRFARTSHHYDGAPCSTFDDRSDIPVECVQGGEDAQRFAADANLIKECPHFSFRQYRRFHDGLQRKESVPGIFFLALFIGANCARSDAIFQDYEPHLVLCCRL